ncbi:hypothetical protein D3C80_924800 [compost metagenome]
MLEHPLPQPRAFAAGRHFLGQHPGIAAPAGEVRHDRPQQQHHDFHMALGNLMRGPGYRIGVVPAERARAFIAAGAFPGEANAIDVVLADTRQALDEELGDGGQPQRAEDPATDLEAHGRARAGERNGSGAAGECANPRAKQATGNGAAGDDHRHLPHDHQQFVDDAVDVEVGEALAQHVRRLPFGVVEGCADSFDPAQVEAQRGDFFIEAGAELATALVAHHGDDT